MDTVLRREGLAGGNGDATRDGQEGEAVFGSTTLFETVALL